MRTPLSFVRARRRPLMATFAAMFVVAGALDLQADTNGQGRVAEAYVDGAIDPGSGEFIKSAIERAEKKDYEALLIRLNTPGGLVSTTREIVEKVFESNVPVIVYVAPSAARAGSAGVFITLSAHVAAMAPTTNIGAAHPIGIAPDKESEEDEHDHGSDKDKDHKSEEWRKSDGEILKKKIENDLAAFAQSIAEERGRNTEWAVKAVRESVSISASKALEMKVIDLIAVDRDDLLSKIDGRTVKLGAAKVEHVLHTKGAPVDELSWGLKHIFLHGIGDPNIASLLLSLGSLGMLIEFYKPGLVVPGVMGGIMLILGLVGLSTLPISAGGVALLLVGIGMFVAEFFVTSHGLLGVAGAICFTAGSILLVDPSGSGDFFADKSFGVRPGAVLPTTIFAVLVALYIGWKGLQARRLKPTVGSHGMIGEIGEVAIDIVPGTEGKLLVHGEIWRAISDRALNRGARAKVVEVEGLTVRVEPPEV